MDTLEWKRVDWVRLSISNQSSMIYFSHKTKMFEKRIAEFKKT